MVNFRERSIITDRREQELFLLFSIAVAGKNSDTTASALGRFMFHIHSPERPLEVIAAINEDQLNEALVVARLSPYVRNTKSFKQAGERFWNCDLATLTTDELEKVHGIGPKTSRFFLFNVQSNFRGAALDTHVLKWLKKLGYPYIPKATPTGQAYTRIERYFLDEADKRGVSPAWLDMEVWKTYKEGREYAG